MNAKKKIIELLFTSLVVGNTLISCAYEYPGRVDIMVHHHLNHKLFVVL